MVSLNKALLNPYFWGVDVARGGRLTSHDNKNGQTGRKKSIQSSHRIGRGIGWDPSFLSPHFLLRVTKRVVEQKNNSPFKQNDHISGKGNNIFKSDLEGVFMLVSRRVINMYGNHSQLLVNVYPPI